MARFELALLSALGYGLDLRACVLTGEKEDLAYVSPKSGVWLVVMLARPGETDYCLIRHFYTILMKVLHLRMSAERSG